MSPKGSLSGTIVGVSAHENTRNLSLSVAGITASTTSAWAASSQPLAPSGRLLQTTGLLKTVFPDQEECVCQGLQRHKERRSGGRPTGHSRATQAPFSNLVTWIAGILGQTAAPGRPGHPAVVVVPRAW